eukprot:GHVT01047617.1.p1 GENE.GHVT01047617.1~~GHVT01047617.1.p1  ORF type:complete len:778 (+),score=64.98 GHVT01047617.1:167-2500(+)
MMCSTHIFARSLKCNFGRRKLVSVFLPLAFSFSAASVSKALASFLSSHPNMATTSPPTFIYPSPRRDETVFEDHFGIKVPDPYRWMEDPDAKETQEFVKQQNELSYEYFRQHPVRDKFHKRHEELFNYPKYSIPFRKGHRYFYHHNTGLQNQYVLYVQDSLHGEPRVFLDPNTWSEDGTSALGSMQFTRDGELLAYKRSEKGSDWSTIKFMKVEDQTDFPDELKRVRYSCLCWSGDNKGVYYNRYDIGDNEKQDGTEVRANDNQQLYYHVLGTKQEEDILIAQFPDHPKWMFGVEVTTDGKYVVMSITEGCEPSNKLWYCDLEHLPEADSAPARLKHVKDNWVRLVDNFDAKYDLITNQGSIFTLVTNSDAPRDKIINVDVTAKGIEDSVILVPEAPGRDVLSMAACVNKDKLVLFYMRDVKSVVEIRSLKDGSFIKEVPIDIGTVGQYSGDIEYNELFFQFTNFLTPGTVYVVDTNLPDMKPVVFRETKIAGLDPSSMEVKQHFVRGKDGESIPMFVVHKKGLKLDGSNPTWLYGYGGFHISLQPSFSVRVMIWIEHLNGVHAVANIRGGGEYGYAWHQAAVKDKKQTCFDDFHMAAKYLIEEKFTRPEKLVIEGGSNGGLLVGACINQHPDTFGAAIAHVPVMDVLRFHKFTIGAAWKSDFGDPEKKEDFKAIIKYSPLHNINKHNIPGAQYPATLIATADHDDRVSPLHSLKFIAELQHQVGTSPSQTNPLLVRVDTKSGHGAGKPTKKILEEAADIQGFVARAINLEWVDTNT